MIIDINNKHVKSFVLNSVHLKTILIDINFVFNFHHF